MAAPIRSLTGWMLVTELGSTKLSYIFQMSQSKIGWNHRCLLEFISSFKEITFCWINNLLFLIFEVALPRSFSQWQRLRSLFHGHRQWWVRNSSLLSKHTLRGFEEEYKNNSQSIRFISITIEYMDKPMRFSSHVVQK